MGLRTMTSARGWFRAASVSLAALSIIAFGSPPAVALPIDSSGPLTTVDVSTDLNCAVNHTGDVDGEFFGDTACGTLLASGGTLYGPEVIPAGGSASPLTAFTPVSQSAVMGSGTGADPFTIVTAVSLGTSPLRITETDTYVTGEESYRTDVTVANDGDLSASAILYRAGDCYLQNSDVGFGSADPSSGAVSCVVDDGGVPGTRIEQWFPLSAGSHYIEDFYDSVWAAIGAQTAFTDSCNQCSNSVDNGAGLSWNLTIPPGGSVTRSHLTVFSPLGRVPLSTVKTADSATAAPGGTDGYTITVHNPNTVSVSLDAITDTLPGGFTYQTGSTTGATTSDPAISGQQLSWSGPISVPASGDASIHFAVTVASGSGTYFNNASGVAEGFTVAPTGDTAPITVAAAGTNDLAVTVTGSGTGTVTSAPSGIDCGTSCSATFDDGTPVDLTATPGLGSTFAGWSGDCSGTGSCSLTMDADHAVTATFTAVETVVPDAPTGVTATPGDASALVGWTPPGSDGGSAIDSYTVTCTATGNGDDTRSATVDGTTTSAQVGGLTNDVEYTCTVTAHNVNGDSEPSDPSAPFTPTASGAQFSTVIDTSEGGELELIPDAGTFQGTVGRITIPPQSGPGVQVTVAASLFGTPGEVDATCGGHICIGQGIQWDVSDPSAIHRMRIAFFLSRSLVRHRNPRTAIVYKDGVPLPNCTSWSIHRLRPVPHTDAARRLVGHHPGERRRPEREDLAASIVERAFGPLTFGLRVLEAS